MAEPRRRVARVREAVTGVLALRGDGRRLRLLASAAAWPMVILVAALFVLRKFAFGGLITNQHEDLLAYWLPTYCLLGRSLAAGVIPDWNPYLMGGVPFAADPQSGWGLVPAMTLFSALPCHAAIRWYIVLLPVQAGLGLYAFARAERLSRPAAAAGGLVIALAIAGSWLTLSLPFAGSIAWTSVMLAAAARLLRASRPGARILWAVLLSLAWGQLAAAHLSHGLILGTLATLLYVAARVVADLRRRRATWARVLLGVGLMALVVPLVNLAILLPRVSYAARATPSLGYAELASSSARLTGQAEPPRRVRGLPPEWPLTMVLSPGAYFGAASLALTAGAWRARRHLHVTGAFIVFGAVCYVLSLEPVAEAVARSWHGRLADLYLHDPVRFRYGTLLSIAVLSALGVEAWRRATFSRQLLTAGIGVLAWWILPFAILSPGAVSSPVFLFGMAAGAVALIVSAFRSTLVVLVPAVLLLELVGNGLAAQGVDYTRPRPSGGVSRWGGIPPVGGPTVEARAYVQATAIARYLGAEEGRYLSLAPSYADPRTSYIRRQRPDFWGLLANNRAMVFGLEDAQGYNPVQPLRGWAFMRIVGAPNAKYSMSFFTSPSPTALDLLDVRWIVGEAGEAPLPMLTPVLTEGRWALYAVQRVPARASLITRWRVTSPQASLDALTSGSFDPSSVALLEQAPGVPRSGPGSGGVTAYRHTGLDEVEIDVEADGASVVLVRNTYDPHWRATVDDRPARVLRADYFLQAVVVPSGEHTIRLSYRDPTVRLGLMGSALSIVLGFGAAVVVGRRNRSPRLHGSGERPVTAAPTPP